MPMYKVTEGDQPARLIHASSKSQAIRHVAANRFTATNITSADEVAELMASGIKREVAGEDDE